MSSFTLKYSSIPGLDVPPLDPNGWTIPNCANEDEAYIDSPSSLTIGLEFKFLIPLLPDGVEDPRPEDPRPVRWTPTAGSDGPKTEEKLLEDGLASVAKTIKATGYHHAVCLPDIQKMGVPESNYWKSCWIVKKANSAEPGEEEKANGKGYIWIPIEINSPRLRAQSPDTLRAVRAVVTQLNKSYRLVTNYSCELHVHLGRFDGRAFTLRTLKKLGTLFWMAEPILRGVKSDKSPNYDNTFTWSSPLRKRSRLWNQLRGPPADATMRIWECADSQALGRLLSGDGRQYRRLGFNFSAFGLEDERATRSPRTVEVRFLEGCGANGDGSDKNKDKGADQVEGWVLLCLALVRVAIIQQEDMFEGLIRQLWAVERQGAWYRQRGAWFEQVMRWLGIDDDRSIWAFRSMIDGF
jgi:hypothetical protein